MKGGSTKQGRSPSMTIVHNSNACGWVFKLAVNIILICGQCNDWAPYAVGRTIYNSTKKKSLETKKTGNLFIH